MLTNESAPTYGGFTVQELKDKGFRVDSIRSYPTFTSVSLAGNDDSTFSLHTDPAGVSHLITALGLVQKEGQSD